MRRLAASCFGLGRLPLAPGTWGSLPPAIIFVLMGRLDAPALTVSVVMAALAVLGSVISIGCAPVVIAVTGKTDPREVVADEFAGQSLAFAIVGSVSLGHIWAAAALGFLLFRFLDILKPWPIRNLEKLPAGWGVLADDLMAGLYAGIVLLFCLRIGLVLYISESFRSDNGSLNVFHAAMLGAIQGLTEFLPVSSSGHLVLFETLFDFNPEEPRMLLFDLAAHAGTVAAIFIVFHRSIAAFFKNLIRSGEYGAGAVEIYKRNPSAHLLVLAVFATIVTG
ncbi:MAG: phosphatidylglycerophosphatase A, partial [Planctomycetota bacterium]